MLVEMQPVRPSWLVRNIMRPLTKMVNPVSVKMAGLPGFRMASRLHHVGRRSGACYITPVGARIKDDHVLIPLTFGNQSDWVRNVRASCGATVEVNRRSYAMGAPEFLYWADVRPIVRSFFPLARSGFKVLGIKQFLYAPVIET